MKKLYFSALLLSAFSFAQVIQVKDIFTGSTTAGSTTTINSGNPNNFFNFNGTLLFRAIDAVATGAELWKSDGTAAGTTIIKDINVGSTVSSSSNPANFTLFANQVFFTAGNGTDQQATELWKTDGSTTGTTLVKDINVTAGASSNPQNFNVLSPTTMLFSASDGINGNELWKTDGTSTGTVNVIDYPGTTNSISWIENLNGLGIIGQIVNTTGREIYKSDGTSAGSSLVLDINSGTPNGTGTVSYKWGNTIYFQGITATAGTELWKTDGTAAGTILIKDIVAGNASSSPARFVGINNDIYFRATGAEGQELWKTDGTAANTVLVADINVGTAGSSPDQIGAVGTNLYFFAADNASSFDFYKYDGTTLTKLADFNALGNTLVTNYTEINGLIYFAADSNSDGQRELWQTDGTVAGTVSVSSYATTLNPLGVNNITLVGSKLFFSAALADGTELFSYTPVILKTNSNQFLSYISVYPNPNQGIITISGNENTAMTYTITDVLGKQIANGSVQNNQIEWQANSGIYFLKLEIDGTSIVKKISKE